jgi:hypothetical protein
MMLNFKRIVASDGRAYLMREYRSAWGWGWEMVKVLG